MSESPHDPRSLVDRAFDPSGPLWDGPKSKGRRGYDQTFWWVRVVKDVGFPIVIAWYVVTRIVPALDALKESEARHTRALAVLLCKTDAATCASGMLEVDGKQAPTVEQAP